ncbi:MAG: alanyl-tRNA synthetase [Gammaproteobacteria bacterium]|nr:MAG: alanyl-tRNA synthetase [Gammaproteobacteria bacterium]TND06679.1 MAG: alanyl-tRNA synthetase [Gammaproteobacteria bacterium]
MTSSAELRQTFLEYFRRHGHEIVPSSSLVPVNDPTLLFTNAGMVQFKDVFLGHDARSYRRAASSQRCVRAGGKHNDLENVGYTARHHTFFEMLGNFSFGDYFKREAIQFAWQFLTKELRLDPKRLWITVYEQDDEAADIWLKEIGVDPAQFARIGASDNFWSMGETGPCGPCSEIFFDHGPDIAGGPPGTPDADGDRYVEIWNLVFMQYNRAADGSLKPLPKPSVDTGMGLERLAAVMQGVHNNYDIDLFRALIDAAARLAGAPDRYSPSLRVIADHIRSCAFLVIDGVIPSNEGRGYVLRRIIRRAVRHGYELGISEPFLFKLVLPLGELMGDAYPELVQNRAGIEKVLRHEEERFAETLEQGMKILKDEGNLAAGGDRVIAGDVVFKLYDTYGFPPDLTADYARSVGLNIDMAGFETHMAAQRERARAASHFGVDYGAGPEITVPTEFTGYEAVDGAARIVALFKVNQSVDRLVAGDEGVVVLDRTPFYAESGGQAGDRGCISANDSRFEVTDTQKAGGGNSFVHVGKVVSGTLQTGDSVAAEVDAARRGATARNHSATHLLHAALREVLGEHVVQKGSLVDASRLRFDFAHFAPVTPEQLARVERIVHEQIQLNVPVQTRVMSVKDAIASGAMAFFGEKYGDKVRVLTMGDFSSELCGGTHVQRTGDIGVFKISSEGGVAAGVRRLEAVSGAAALQRIAEDERRLADVMALVKGDRDTVLDRVRQVMERNRLLEKELDQLKGKLASQAGGDLAARAININGLQVIAARLEGIDAKALRDTVDQLKNKLGSAAVVLASVADNKIRLVAGVTKDYADAIPAGELVNVVAEKVGGRGGGRADMAQAGGDNPAALDGALAAVLDWVRERVTP